MAQPPELTLDTFQRRLASGECQPLDWWKACRERIEARKPEVQAWEFLGAEAKQVPAEGALRGVPVGIKDIIDTCDMPTAWRTTGGHTRSADSLVDAAVVTLPQQQGALVMGKAVSTEFPYFTPGKTRNPLDVSRTPAGASSGSAAAVADGMVPLAFGTQTAGSIIRPASFCGVYGFKSTFGMISIAGIKPFAPSLNPLGWFARHVEDICTTYSTLTRASTIEALPDVCGIRVGVRSLPGDETLNADVAQALREAQKRFEQAGASVFALPLAARFDALVEQQKVIMAYEAAQSLTSEYRRDVDQMGPKRVELIQQGLALSYTRYREARMAAVKLRQVLSRTFEEEGDVILAASAQGEAPAGLDATRCSAAPGPCWGRALPQSAAQPGRARVTGGRPNDR